MHAGLARWRWAGWGGLLTGGLSSVNPPGAVAWVCYRISLVVYAKHHPHGKKHTCEATNWLTHTPHPTHYP